MKPVIVKTGSTLPALRERRGDYEDWIAAGMGVALERFRVVPVYEGEPLPPSEQVPAVVVTGSAAYVSDREPWSERSAAWLREIVGRGTPVLGICYGHQLLAHALGGAVGRNPRGREMGTVAIDLLAPAREDALLGAFDAPLCMQATHVESVLRLPQGARRLGENAADPHHAFAFGERAWGIQFHPEFDDGVMRAYLQERRQILRDEGIDPEPLERGVAASPQGPVLLRRFADLAGLSV